MVILAICNTADQTGKTTSAIQLGAALGLSGRRTLVVDLDPAGWLSKRMGVFTPSPSDSALALFQHDVDPSGLELCRFKAFDLLPSSTGLRSRAQSLTKSSDVFWVKEALAGVSEYEFVILDTSGGFRPFILNALVASGMLLIPLCPSIHAVESAEHTWQLAREVKSRLNPDLQSAHFLFTFAQDGHEDVALTRMRRQYSSQVMGTVIRESTILSLDLQIIGRTVFDISVRSRGAVDYAGVADELISRLDSQVPANRL